MSNPTDPPGLARADKLQIDALADEFERALKAGQSPRIEELVNQIREGARLAAMRELLEVEIELRHGIPESADARRMAHISSSNGETQASGGQSDVRLPTSEYNRAPPAKNELSTRQHRHSDTGSGRLEVRCPNCHAPTEVAVDTVLTDLTCSACGSHFSLVDQNKATRMAPSLTKLGRFELIERLGVGGFGSVWKARDKELDRTVAIKIPRAGGMTGEEQEKFFREARAAAQLRHPNIVSVHEVGRDGDSVYIVSDFVRGVTLGDWLTGQQLTSREGAELCAKIADALHHAHEQGVVHRDLKPANIMMDYNGQPHLMDFGLARRETGEITMTMDGQILGTPAYMSPEQAQGEAHTADRRSDIYSLGVILFQLLTGELPFRGNARMLIKQVVHDEPPNPRKLNGSIKRDLETITLKCLEKAPTRRYQTARELSDELQRFLKREPILARPVSRFERAIRWSARHRAQAALIGMTAVAMLLIVGLAVGLAFQRQLQSAYDAEAAAHRVESDLKRQIEKMGYLHGIRSALRDWQIGELGPTRTTLKRIAEKPPQWEWKYLNRLCDGNLGNFTGHTNAIWGIACSSDATLAASSSEDGTVCVWNVLTGKLVHKHKLNGAAWAVAMSPDGAFLAAGGAGGVITVWDAKSGNYLFDLEGEPGDINCLAFSADSSMLAGAGGAISRNGVGSSKGNTQSNTIRLWRLPDRKPIATFRGHESAVMALAISPNGKYIASGDFGGRIRIWDTAAGSEQNLFAEHKLSINGLAFEREGKSFFSCSEDQTIKKWSVNEKSSVVTYSELGLIRSIALSKDGKTLACGVTDSTIRLIDAQSGKEQSVLRGHEGNVTCLLYSKDSRLLFSGGTDRTLRMWDSKARQEFRALRKHSDWIQHVAFLPGTTSLVSEGRDGMRCTWDALTGQLVDRVPAAGDSCFAVTSDGNLIASPAADHTIRIVEMGSGRERHALRGHKAQINQIRFSSNGRILASADFQVRVILWDVESGAELRRLSGFSVAFSPDGKLFATGENKMTRIWDVSTGKNLATLSGHENYVLAIAFSPDGHTVLTGCGDKTAKLWDVRTGNHVADYKGVEAITSVAFSPDGQRVIMADGARLKIALPTNLDEVLALKGGPGNLHSVAFSDDGDWIAAGGWDSIVYVWDGRALRVRGNLKLIEDDVQTFEKSTHRLPSDVP